MKDYSADKDFQTAKDVLDAWHNYAVSVEEKNGLMLRLHENKQVLFDMVPNLIFNGVHDKPEKLVHLLKSFREVERGRLFAMLEDPRAFESGRGLDAEQATFLLSLMLKQRKTVGGLALTAILGARIAYSDVAKETKQGFIAALIANIKQYDQKPDETISYLIIAACNFVQIDANLIVTADLLDLATAVKKHISTTRSETFLFLPMMSLRLALVALQEQESLQQLAQAKQISNIFRFCMRVFSQLQYAVDTKPARFWAKELQGLLPILKNTKQQHIVCEAIWGFAPVNDFRNSLLEDSEVTKCLAQLLMQSGCNNIFAVQALFILTAFSRATEDLTTLMQFLSRKQPGQLHTSLLRQLAFHKELLVDVITRSKNCSLIRSALQFQADGSPFKPPVPENALAQVFFWEKKYAQVDPISGRCEYLTQMPAEKPSYKVTESVASLFEQYSSWLKTDDEVRDESLAAGKAVELSVGCLHSGIFMSSS